MTFPKLHVLDCWLGKGLFAAEEIQPGQRILTFTGQRINKAKAIAMGHLEANPLQTELDEYIDVEPPALYVNHSCSPNAGLKDNVFLVALETIHPGSQLFFDYSTSMLERRWEMQCKCGSSNCRDVVRDFDRLPRQLQAKYMDMGVVQKFIVDAIRR